MKKLVTALLGKYLNTLAIVSPQVAGRKGFYLFCRPFRTPLKSYHKEFLNSSEKFTIDFNNYEIQCYRWGHGERKVLFLHGWQSHSFRWKNYIQSLSQDEFTIYAMDAPGHGFSTGSYLSVPLYSDLIEFFLSRYGEFDSVIGHSLGSFAAIYALHNQPFLPINRLILMAPPGEATDFFQFYRDTLNLSSRAMQLTSKYFEHQFGKPAEYFSTARFAASLRLPGLIIHDELDDETPYRYGEKISKVWKDSRLFTTSGLGHNLKSPEVVKVVQNYIQGKIPVDGAWVSAQ